jgi:Aspartyl protease
MKPQSFFLPTLFFAILLPSAASAQAAQTSIQLKIITGMPVVDGVFLNGHGPYRFLLDTASQSNQMDSGLARKLGLAATLQLNLETPSGESTVHGGRVSEVTLGPVEASEQEFLFTRFKDLSTLPSDIRGILGQEFLARFDYILDFQHHRLTFGEPSARGVQTSFRLIFGRMAVPTSLGDLVLDSGTEMLFLFRESTRAASAQVIGASGARVGVSFETAPEVRIGDHRYRPAKAEYHPVPAAEEAGLLPANLFHAIFICNSKQYVVFDPLP